TAHRNLHMSRPSSPTRRTSSLVEQRPSDAKRDGLIVFALADPLLLLPRGRRVAGALPHRRIVKRLFVFPPAIADNRRRGLRCTPSTIAGEEAECGGALRAVRFTRPAR